MLSIYEVLQYFGDSGLVARGVPKNTVERSIDEILRMSPPNRVLHDQYNEARRARDSWWIRTPGFNYRMVMVVAADGGFIIAGRGASSAYAGIRPAMWIRITP